MAEDYVGEGISELKFAYYADDEEEYDLEEFKAITAAEKVCAW